MTNNKYVVLALFYYYITPLTLALCAVMQIIYIYYYRFLMPIPTVRRRIHLALRKYHTELEHLPAGVCHILGTL